MKRRTLLAGALLKPAQWLLIDEPTRGLDPEEQQTVMDLLQQESTQRGLIVVTQRLEEAEILQKRVVLVDSGHIRFDGTPEALAAQARDHVFRVSSELPVADFSLWQPLVQPFGAKVYHAQSVEGGQALVPTLEDGYFWTLLADEERAQGV
jgi:ABC-2 type transport system ATP-binding protein